MQMEKLTAPLLRELIDRIEVYETQGVGKNRTQKIVIHYRFVGYIDIQEAPLKEHYVVETQQGVVVEVHLGIKKSRYRPCSKMKHKKCVFITQIRYEHSIWLREWDLNLTTFGL